MIPFLVAKKENRQHVCTIIIAIINWVQYKAYFYRIIKAKPNVTTLGTKYSSCECRWCSL